MNEASKDLYRETKAYFTSRVLKEKELIDDAITIEDCVDSIYAIRESIEYLESVRKKLQSLSQEMQNIVCLTLMSRHRKSYKTNYCTGTKRSSTVNGLPTKKRNPEDYVALMTHLGIPADVIRRDLVRVHWPSWKEYMDELNTKGEPAPPGVGEPSSVFTVAIRKSRDILSEVTKDESNENEETPF